MLLRLACPDVTSVFALLRLLPVSGRDKDAEIPVLRHRLLVSQRRLGPGRVRFTASDRALLRRLPGQVLKSLYLVVCPDTVFRWHHVWVPKTCVTWPDVPLTARPCSQGVG